MCLEPLIIERVARELKPGRNREHRTMQDRSAARCGAVRCGAQGVSLTRSRVIALTNIIPPNQSRGKKKIETLLLRKKKKQCLRLTGVKIARDSVSGNGEYESRKFSHYAMAIA